MHALTRNIALEYGAYNIRCNAIAPGWIDTPFNEELLRQYPDIERARQGRGKICHPLRRMGTAEDIADMALFLAGDDSSFARVRCLFWMAAGRRACRCRRCGVWRRTASA